MAMAGNHRLGSILLISIVCLACWVNFSRAGDIQWPVFGRDTVLVWKIHNQGFTSEFVVRIAEFFPNRFVEWEDMVTQGTVFMPYHDIREAKGFSSSLFEAGMDIQTKDVTALWLSQKLFRELKEKKKAKYEIDRVRGWLTLAGSDQLSVDVNHSPMVFPVIRVLDDRKAERWFLDQEDNPLMVQHLVRQYRQTLESITTNRPNTLRWIKGKKLVHLLQ